MSEAYEVATFYAHFDVLKEGDAPLPELTIRVCDSLTCEMMGAETLLPNCRIVMATTSGLSARPVWAVATWRQWPRLAITTLRPQRRRTIGGGE